MTVQHQRWLLSGGYLIQRSPNVPVPELRRADVVVDGQRIADVIVGGGASEQLFSRTVDISGRLVLPGLVNAHSHSYGNLARGVSDGLPLEPWSEYIRLLTVGRSPDEIYLSVLLGCIEMIRTGTTCVLDHLGGDIDTHRYALEAYRDAGMRVTFAPMVRDRYPFERVPYMPSERGDRHQALVGKAPIKSASAVVRSLRTLFKDWHGKGLVRLAVGPSGPERCSDDLLRKCGRLAKEFGAGVHAHLLETPAQRVVASRPHRGAPESMVARLARLEVLDAPCSFAHGVWCAGQELRTLADHGSVLVHNPQSNLTMGSGVAPLAEWRQAGVVAALGTDGPNSGCSLNMFHAMTLAATLQRAVACAPGTWPTTEEVFAMATTGSAAGVFAADEVGAVRPGQQADLVVLSLDSPTYVPLNSPLTQVVLGESGSNVETVIIGGRVVLAGGQFTTLDEQAVLTRSREVSKAYAERTQGLFAAVDARRDSLVAVAVRGHQTFPGVNLFAGRGSRGAGDQHAGGASTECGDGAEGADDS